MAVGRMEPLAAALEPGGWLGARRVVHRGIIASAARQAAARTRAGPRHVPPPLPPRDASAPRAHRSHAAGPSILRPGTPLSRPMPAAEVEEAWAQRGRAGGLVARVPAAEPAVVVGGGGPRRGRAGRPACRPRLTGHASRIPPGGAAGTRGVPAAAAPVGLFREQGTSGHAAAGGTGTHPAAPPRR
jgi:hypothetical protein